MSINENVIDVEAKVTQQEEVNTPKLELEITKEQPGILEWKFDELNSALDFELARYKNAKITTENFNDAKKVRADLNALSKAINDKKISVKKTFNAPYLEFESKVKVLLTKIKNVVDPIDSGIKALEDEEKKAKKAEIISFFIEGIQTLEEPFASNLLLEYVFDSRWLNKSCSKSKWQDELNNAVGKIYQTYKSIETMYPGETDRINDLKGIFCSTGKFNLEDTLRAYSLMQQAKKQQELIAQHQEEYQEPIQAVDYQTTPIPEENVPLPTPQHEEVKEELYELTFMVRATKQQLNALAAFLNEAGIKFKQL